MWKMSTLADELLNDFEDSGSGGEGEQNGFLQDEPKSAIVGARGRQNGFNEMDVDEDEDPGEDEEMADGATLQTEPLEDADDEEEAKAKVEKMQLGGVNDVRSVAGLMETLKPVLEVGLPFLPLRSTFKKLGIYICCVNIALTNCVPSRKSDITNRSRQRSKQLWWALLKITPNIISSRSQIRFPLLLITKSFSSTSLFETTIPPDFLNWRHSLQTRSIMQSRSLLSGTAPWTISRK